MKHLDSKYKKEIIEKKYMQGTFQKHLTTEYKQKSKIVLKSLLGNIEVNNGEKEEEDEKESGVSLSASFRSFSSSPSKIRKKSRNI